MATKLITDEYRAMNAELHKSQPFGITGAEYGKDVCKLAEDNGFTTILDYGCGRGSLKDAIAELNPRLKVIEYDPAIEGKSSDPPVCDIVFCSHVLEHVEPDCLEAVLDHMKLKTGQVMFAVVPSYQAEKNLPDGRNAHLIQKPPAWWGGKFDLRYKRLFAMNLLHVNGKVKGIAYVGEPIR